MFTSIIRIPDKVEIESENGWLKSNMSSAKIVFDISKTIKITLTEANEPIKRIKLTWKGDFGDVERVLGDSMGVAKFI